MYPSATLVNIHYHHFLWKNFSNGKFTESASVVHLHYFNYIYLVNDGTTSITHRIRKHVCGVKAQSFALWLIWRVHGIGECISRPTLGSNN